MSLSKAAASQAVSSSPLDDAACRIKHVVPTGAVFAAALDRLNRKSAMALFQELARELDEHGRRLADASKNPKDVSLLRAELLALLSLLRQTTEQHHGEVALIKQQLDELSAQSAATQAALESQLSALVSAQLDRHFLRAFTEASARQERSVSSIIERDLKSISLRLTDALAPQRRWRACVLLLLLGILLGAALFSIGMYTARRLAPPPCAPALTTAATVPASSAALAAAPLAPSAKLEAAPATMAPGATQSDAGSPACSHAGAPGSNSSAQSIAALPKAPGSKTRIELLPVPLELSAFEMQPGTMEAELLEFLRRPGPRGTHVFVMDRLRYPAASHEMNAEGKEQVFLLAKILLAHPSVHIEIRGHSDGIESETYTGPDPVPGYSLSQLRANCVLRRLQGLRVPSGRMRIRGMAATEPVADDQSPEGRQHNRRVDIVVLPN